LAWSERRAVVGRVEYNGRTYSEIGFIFIVGVSLCLAGLQLYVAEQAQQQHRCQLTATRNRRSTDVRRTTFDEGEAQRACGVRTVLSLSLLWTSGYNKTLRAQIRVEKGR